MDGKEYSVYFLQVSPFSDVLVADFNALFLNKLEVLKLVQKTKLSNAEKEQFEDFLQNLSAVDFNNRNEESKYK